MLNDLTHCEYMLIKLFAEGLTIEQVSARMLLKPQTINTYVRNARVKMDANNRTHLIARAYQLGLLPIDGGAETDIVGWAVVPSGKVFIRRNAAILVARRTGEAMYAVIAQNTDKPLEDQ